MRCFKHLRSANFLIIGLHRGVYEEATSAAAFHMLYNSLKNTTREELAISMSFSSTFLRKDSFVVVAPDLLGTFTKYSNTVSTAARTLSEIETSCFRNHFF